MERTAEQRLATYGTLAPGKPNAHQLSALSGRWLEGSVRGHLIDSGWGAKLGFPGLVLDPSGPPLTVSVFESADLPQHWPRLDQFEGDGYLRVRTDVETSEGTISASIYVIKDSP
ncbi:MAG: gamma-glutamylcyclotransferase [Pseudomonadota bacterium]